MQMTPGPTSGSKNSVAQRAATARLDLVAEEKFDSEIVKCTARRRRVLYFHSSTFDAIIALRGSVDATISSRMRNTREKDAIIALSSAVMGFLWQLVISIVYFS